MIHKENTNRPPTILSHIFQKMGVHVNGHRPIDIQIHRPDFYHKVLSRWSLGLGESYLDGDWDCADLDGFITKILEFDLNDEVKGIAKVRMLGEILRAKWLNMQSPKHAFQVGEQHYDVGNDLFEHMLDPRMIYSCGYWENAASLEEAQRHKLDMICRKLELKAGESLLDIGCGWGGLLEYAAKNYGVKAVGITVSKEQQKLAEQRCQGLPVEINLIDYRDLTGRFDKIVSVGMFEHVGKKNYPTYFDMVCKLLKDEGLFLLHTIGSDITISRTDPWIHKYIFPNGEIPSPIEITRHLEKRFLIEDWHNFGQDYDKTLMAWHEKFERAWPELKEKYSERFHRMWRYYLLSCAGYFRSRQGQLWQIVLTKRARKAVYRSVRVRSQGSELEG
jgi:cyclopropane-fatty-acyl-phospholipid synthase